MRTGSILRSNASSGIILGAASPLSETLGRYEEFSRYLKQVRKVIPDHIQEAIRKHCGDRRALGSIYALELPANCPIKLSDDHVAGIAVDLRAQPELRGELRWHMAAVAN